MLVFSLFYGFYVGAPFLAPVLMHIGLEGTGRAIYWVYSYICHQLPQRSYFLFGPKFTYSLGDIQAAWQNTINPLVLRQFIGNPEMGWKVAWSDRMISMYTSILFFAWVWYPLRKKIRPLCWWGMVLFLLPMGMDGLTHMISDFSGIGQGFRDSNSWLAMLSNHSYPVTFYVGDALGSFNSWLRLITGILFGLGVVWFGFPYLEAAFDDTARTTLMKFRHAELEP